MPKTYQKLEIDTSQPAVPDTVRVELAELAGVMREGLLSLAVGPGLQVTAAMMEADVAAVCRPKSRHDPERTAVRHDRGTGSGRVGSDRVGSGRVGSGRVGYPGWAPGTGTTAVDARDRRGG